MYWIHTELLLLLLRSTTALHASCSILVGRRPTGEALQIPAEYSVIDDTYRVANPRISLQYRQGMQSMLRVENIQNRGYTLYTLYLYSSQYTSVLRIMHGGCKEAPWNFTSSSSDVAIRTPLRGTTNGPNVLPPKGPNHVSLFPGKSTWQTKELFPVQSLLPMN